MDISVIIPIYNAEKYLDRCISSILDQTAINQEVLLIDDGSTDRSPEICDVWVKQDARVLVKHISNGGVSNARNIGLRMAKGKYVFFCDADDYVESGALRKLQDLANCYTCDMVVSGYYFDINNKSQKTNNLIPTKIKPKLYETKEEIKEDMVYLWDQHMMYNIWNKLFCLEIIRDHKIQFPTNKIFNEDRDFIRKYLLYTNTLYITDLCTYHYIKENGDSATEKYRQDLFEIRVEEYERLNQFFKNNGVNRAQYMEYLSRQHLERVMGCVENLFHNPKVIPKEIKQKIKEYIQHPYTVDSLVHAKPKSKKVKIMILPYCFNNVFLIYWMTYFIYKIRINYPQLFNQLKQRR